MDDEGWFVDIHVWSIATILSILFRQMLLHILVNVLALWNDAVTYLVCLVILCCQSSSLFITSRLAWTFSQNHLVWTS